MLIVTQKGDRAVVLDNVSCIEIDPRTNQDLVAVYRKNFLDDNPTLASYRDKYLKTFWLGTFPNKSAAQRAFDCLICACESGKEVHKIKPYDFYNTDAPLCC